MKSILFRPKMAVAYRRGLKTQTRRILWKLPLDGSSPYGRVGDRVVLLTTWATESRYDHLKPTELPSNARIWSYFESDNKILGELYHTEFGRLRSGRFMPKKFWHWMPQPHITGIRNEHVQDISHDDAIDEGVGSIEEYATLWDEINGDRCAWKWNPMIGVINLEKIG